ncbi:hypothetical protein ACHAPJ_001762 [Fusarium lateritium]
MQDAQVAFRFVKSGAQMGKVVLLVGTDEEVHVILRLKGVTARSQLRSDASYLIMGDVGGIGRSATHWTVARGAKNLILFSRSAGDLDLDQNKVTNGALFVRELRKMGCRVKSVSSDIALPSSLTTALGALQDDGFASVRGVIQGAMLLRDDIFEQMTLDD